MRPAMTALEPHVGERTLVDARLGAFARLHARVALLAGLLLAPAISAARTPSPRDLEAEFGADVELAPFVVRGEQLAISIHARSARDRKYAEAFAGEVVNIVHEGVTEHTGKGLVIIGAKGEPHPMVVFRRFQEMAAAGQLAPEVAARADELSEFLDTWKTALNDGEGEALEAESAEVDLDFEMILNALPLPLEGVGAKLYQIAWAERFDAAKLDARLRALQPDDLQRDVFARFDWVFYLPPKGAFERVINDILAQALKEEDIGFFGRMAMRTVLTVVKPMIRRAIEGMRKGMLFVTVVRAQTDYTDEQVSVLAEAYLEVLMPESAGKGRRGSEHERAIWALREAVEEFGTAERAVENQPGSLNGGDTPETATPAGASSGPAVT